MRLTRSAAIAPPAPSLRAHARRAPRAPAITRVQVYRVLLATLALISATVYALDDWRRYATYLVRRLRRRHLRSGAPPLRALRGTGQLAQGRRVLAARRPLQPDPRGARTALLGLAGYAHARTRARCADRGVGLPGLLLQRAPARTRARAPRVGCVRVLVAVAGPRRLRLPRDRVRRAARRVADRLARPRSLPQRGRHLPRAPARARGHGLRPLHGRDHPRRSAAAPPGRSARRGRRRRLRSSSRGSRSPASHRAGHGRTGPIRPSAATRSQRSRTSCCTRSRPPGCSCR